MQKALFFLLAFLISAPALGQKYEPQTVTSAVGTGLEDADLSGSPVSSTIDVRGFSRIKWQVQLTRGGGATNVSAACDESEDGTNWAEIQRDTAGTLTKYTITRTTSVSLDFSFYFDVLGFVYVRCTFDGASATGADTITVLARRARGARGSP